MAFMRSNYSPTFWFILLWLMSLWHSSLTQVGLRSLPISPPGNHSALHLLNRWGDPMTSNSRYGSPSVEMELAAILRDIAYGDKDESSSSSSTSTSTPILSTTESITIFSPSEVPVSKNTETDFKPTKSEVIPSYVYSSSPSSTPLASSNPLEDDYSWKFHLDSFLENERNQKEVKEFKVKKELARVPESEIYSKKPREYGQQFHGEGFKNYGTSWIAPLGIMWQVYIYAAAGFFSLLVLFSLYCLTRFYFSTQLLSRGYYMTINLLIFLAAFFRCVYFFHDPYQISNLLPKSLSNILFQTSLPLVVAALGLLILAVLQAARLVIIPFGLQSPMFVAVVSGGLLLASLTSDILSGLNGQKLMVLEFQGVVQALTSGWEAALCISFFAIFVQIEKAAEREQQEIFRLTLARINSNPPSLPYTVPKSAIRLNGRLTLMTCVIGLLLSALQIYGLIHSKMVVYTPPLEPWAWFAYQAFCRVLEVIMWFTICLASSLPTQFNRNCKKSSLISDCHHYQIIYNLCTCCSYKEKPTEDMYSAICQSSHVARNFSLHSDSKLTPHNVIISSDASSNHVNNLLVPSIKSYTFGKCSSNQMISANSYFGWNKYQSDSKTLESSIRPSSFRTNEGFVKLSSNQPHSETLDIAHLTNELNEKTLFITQSFQTPYDNCNQSIEDNYVNSNALTPEDVKHIEDKANSEKLFDINNCSSKITNFDSFQNNILESCSGRVVKGYSPLYDSNKSENVLSTSSIRSNSSPHSDDDDLYQSSAVSSIESSGHIYASIHQSLDYSGDSSNHILRTDAQSGNVCDHSKSDISPTTPVKNNNISRKLQYQRIKENRNDTEFNKRATLNPSRTTLENKTTREEYFSRDTHVNRSMNGPMENDCHYYFSELDDIPKKYVISKNYVDPTCINYIKPQRNELTSPKSPNQKLKFLSNSRGGGTFAEVKYTQLCRNEDSTKMK